jgi:hypothetical protein
MSISRCKNAYYCPRHVSHSVHKGNCIRLELGIDSSFWGANSANYGMHNKVTWWSWHGDYQRLCRCHHHHDWGSGGSVSHCHGHKMSPKNQPSGYCSPKNRDMIMRNPVLMQRSLSRRFRLYGPVRSGLDQGWLSGGRRCVLHHSRTLGLSFSVSLPSAFCSSSSSVSSGSTSLGTAAQTPIPPIINHHSVFRFQEVSEAARVTALMLLRRLINYGPSLSK